MLSLEYKIAQIEENRHVASIAQMSPGKNDNIEHSKIEVSEENRKIIYDEISIILKVKIKQFSEELKHHSMS